MDSMQVTMNKSSKTLSTVTYHDLQNINLQKHMVKELFRFSCVCDSVHLPNCLPICGPELLSPVANFPSTCFLRAARAGRGGSERSYLCRAAATQPVAAFEALHCEILPGWFDDPRLHRAGPPLSPQEQRSNPRRDAQGRSSRRGSASWRTKRPAPHARSGSLSHFAKNVLALPLVTICFINVIWTDKWRLIFSVFCYFVFFRHVYLGCASQPCPLTPAAASELQGQGGNHCLVTTASLVQAGMHAASVQILGSPGWSTPDG